MEVHMRLKDHRGQVLAIASALLVLVPASGVAQTTKVLQAVHLKVSFPKGWTVERMQLKQLEVADEELTLSEVFASAARGMCSPEKIRQAYVARSKAEPDISVVVMELDLNELSTQLSRNCALAATNQRMKDVKWKKLPTGTICAHVDDGSGRESSCPIIPWNTINGFTAHGSAMMRQGESWREVYVGGLFRRPRFPKRTPQKRGAVYFAVVAPIAKAKQAQRAVADVYGRSERLPVDCSGLGRTTALLEQWNCKEGTLPRQK
jgi:hypothetical protein